MSKFSGTRRALAGCMLVPAALMLLAACSDSVAPSSITSAVPADSAPGTFVRWSDAAAWPNGAVPKSGADVVIPEGTRMVLDVSPAAMRTLTIRGELSIGDADVAISAARIDVFGTFRAGSADHPYRRKLTVTLTDGTTDDLRKGILVQAGGDLELFGEPRVMWTRLTNTAPAGATSLAVDSATSWHAGDRVVVASTDVDQSHAEVMELAHDANGNALSLRQPLQFQHWGVTQQVAGRTLDERAEVGLLTHNIVIQGDDNSEQSGIGAHVMVMWHGTAHVDGVEFFRAGQRGVLARYPFHWHLAGDVDGQFVKRSSVWHSFNRCMTIHGTNDALLEDNVCYDHIGHGYFIEDGIEHGNTIRGNLGLLSHAGTLLGSDAGPATFWITNPDNTVDHNVAAGSIATGFWIAPVYHPTGPSSTNTVWPSYTPLRRFSDNVSHSAKGDAFHVEGPVDVFGQAYTDYRPRTGGTPDGTPVVANLTNLVMYKNGRGFWGRGDHMTVTNAIVADNRVGMQIGDAGLTSDSYIEGTLFVGASDNGPAPYEPPVGFRLYDGAVHLENNTFANFGAMSGGGSAIANLPGFDGRMSAMNSITGSRFVDATPIHLAPKPTSDADWEGMIQDLDGSITGRVGSVVSGLPITLDSTCTQHADWYGWSCTSPHVTLWVTNAQGVAPATVTRDDRVQWQLYGWTPAHVTLNVPAMRSYTISPASFTGTAFTFETEGLAPGQWVVASMPWPRAAGGAFPAEATYSADVVTSRSALDASSRTSVWFDTTNNLVYIRFVGTAAAMHQKVGILPAGQHP